MPKIDLDFQIDANRGETFTQASANSQFLGIEHPHIHTDGQIYTGRVHKVEVRSDGKQCTAYVSITVP